MNGLALFEQGRKELVQLQGFRFTQADTGSGFGTDKFVFALGGRSGIETFFQSTFMFVGAAVTNIGRLGKRRAELLGIIRAIKMTFRTKGTRSR